MTKTASKLCLRAGSITPERNLKLFSRRLALSTWILKVAISRVLRISRGVNLRPLPRYAQARINGGMLRRAFRWSNKSRIVKIPIRHHFVAFLDFVQKSGSNGNLSV